MANKKQENLDFFNKNLSTYLKDEKLKHKFLVVHDKEVKGCFDTFALAIEFASNNFSVGEFVVQQVIGEDEQINFIRSAI